MTLPQRSPRKCQVARKGKALGNYDAEQIRDLLAARELQLNDHYYEEDSGTWHPLSEWKESQSSAPPPEAKAIPNQNKKFSAKKNESSTPPGEHRSGRGKGESRGAQGPALGGWIACLFALGAAAGLWTWSQSLNDTVRLSSEKIREQAAQIDHLNNQISLLSELTPPGRVRAIITYEPDSQNVAVVSGVRVELFRRADVAAALASMGDAIANSPQELHNDFTEFKKKMPSAMEIGITQSNGRIDMAVPDPGEYVLLASAAKAGPAGQVNMLYWILGFQSNNQASELILMSEKIAITMNDPDLRISDSRKADQAVPTTAPDKELKKD